MSASILVGVGCLVVGYLLGGIPWALIIGTRFYGVDPREHGSGNLGATNVFRVLGARAAIVTLLLDAAKGSLAVAIAMLVVPREPALVWEWMRVLAMVTAVLGHMYSPYIRLRGGKGVATSAGGLFVLTPLAAVIELSLFIGITATTRIVSLSSILIAILYPVLVLTLPPYRGDLPLAITSFALAGLVLFQHRSNMGRILRGEENRVSLSGRGEAAKRKDGE